MKKITILLILLLILGCQMQPQVKGILQGKVSIGPLCPVERNPPDPRCQPTEATYKAWPLEISKNGVKVANIVPTADGTFSIELAPGTYVVDLEKESHFGKGTLPATVTIKSGETTNLDIDIDTGIR